MAIFEYKGLTVKGKNASGLKEADNIRQAKAALQGEGIYVTDISESLKKNTAGDSEAKESGLKKLLPKFGSAVSAADLALTTRQLSTLLGSGINLVEALGALIDQVENPNLKMTLSEIKGDVNEGNSLYESMKKHPKVFSGLYVNMINAGEASGALELVLDRLADFTENQNKTKNKVIGTLIYPAIMILFMGLIVLFMFVNVIPKITQIFEDTSMSLPLPTQILMAVSGFLVDWWWLLFIILFIAIFAFKKWVATKNGKASYDRKILNVPLFGGMIRVLAISQFTKTLATLLSSGVPLLQAMDIVKNVVQNTVLKGVIENASDQIREGESITTPLKKSGFFPPMVIHMISVGEKSGELEKMLEKIADTYEAQIEVKVNSLTSLIEPLIIVMMGMVIGTIALAILVPIMNMNELVN